MTRALGFKTWTPEDTAALIQMWMVDGLTGTQIGAKFGVSRNSIIGKVHRLGLPPRPKKIRLYGDSPRKRKPQPYKPRNDAQKAWRALRQREVRAAKAEAPRPYVPPPEEPISLDVSLVDLRPGYCKWPHGDGPFLFCGHRTEGRPYCPFHHHLAYQPIELRALAA